MEESKLSKLANHFKSKVNNELRGIQIDDCPEVFYYKEPTAFERDAIIPIVQSGKLYEGYAETIIQLARDETGKKMFKSHERRELMRKLPSKFIEKLATSIFDELKDDEEDADLYKDEVIKK